MKKKNNIFLMSLGVLVIIFIIIILMIVELKKYNKSIGREETNTKTSEEEEYVYKEVEKENTKTLLYILSKCINDNTQNYYNVQEIYRINKDEGKTYFVKGFIDNNQEYYIIDLDYINLTYKIELTNEFEYNNIKNGNVNNKYLEISSIEPNGTNSFELVDMTDDKIVKMYFSMIKNLLKYQQVELYNKLDEEYKQIRFGDFNNFSEYISKNRSKIENMEVEKYAKYEYDDYNQYVCIDNNGDYYIINDKYTTGEYSLILDTYTVTIPEFIKKYEQANIETKLKLNINRFINGINDKNYNFAYSVLADSFKNNYYSNINLFTKYIEDNLPEEYIVEFGEISAQENTYVCKGKLTNKSLTSTKNLTVIMRLGEGTQFEMSFNLE